MKPEIAKINECYLQIQDYVFPTNEVLDNWRSLTDDEMIEIRSLISKFKPEYQILVKQLWELAKASQSSEILVAYQEGCRLLKINLSGFMCQNYSEEFLPVMADAIKQNHSWLGKTFLQCLANNIGEDIKPLVEYALDVEILQSTALNVIGQLKLVDFTPKVR